MPQTLQRQHIIFLIFPNFLKLICFVQMTELCRAKSEFYDPTFFGGFIYLSIYLTVCLYVCLSICFSMYLITNLISICKVKVPGFDPQRFFRLLKKYSSYKNSYEEPHHMPIMVQKVDFRKE